MAKKNKEEQSTLPSGLSPLHMNIFNLIFYYDIFYTIFAVFSIFKSDKT